MSASVAIRPSHDLWHCVESRVDSRAAFAEDYENTYRKFDYAIRELSFSFVFVK